MIPVRYVIGKPAFLKTVQFISQDIVVCQLQISIYSDRSADPVKDFEEFQKSRSVPVEKKIIGLAGVTVAREIIEYHENIWVLVSLVVMSAGVIVSTAIRLIKRYAYRYAK